MRAAILALLVACGGREAVDPVPDPEPRALGMNDVTLLLPLPADRAAPVLLGVDGAGGASGGPLVPRALYDELVAAPGDLGPKNGLPVAFADYHVVAVRFDLCAREVAGPCPEGADGRLRLVLQPLYTVAGETLAHDLALHAFYPIPAAELAGVVAELRALARLGGAPADGPLAVSPALAAGAPEYTARLRALVAGHARAERLVRLTVFGQDARSAAFAWIFRGVDVRASVAERMTIPGLGAPGGPGVLQQAVQLSGGDTIYTASPVADAPHGFALALNGVMFAAASPDERRGALEALAEIQSPARHDAGDVQCASCHVATFLTLRRAELAGLDPAAVAGRYASAYDTRVDPGVSIAARDNRVLRALGWAARSPAISQRVANDTAQVLAEIERRFPLESGGVAARGE